MTLAFYMDEHVPRPITVGLPPESGPQNHEEKLYEPVAQSHMMK
jgi:hypothetical protein